MKFIIIFEKNEEHDRTYIHYCQWKGNEVELRKLMDVIDKAIPDRLDTFYSIFSYSDVKIKESAVDNHMKIKNDMFHKHIGKFVCPEFSEDEYEMADELAEMYDNGTIMYSFKTE